MRRIPVKKIITTAALLVALAGCATMSEQDRINVEAYNLMKAIGYSHSVEMLRYDLMRANYGL